MGKVIMHGILIEEPIKRTIGNNCDVITLVVEEKYKTAFRDVINVFNVDFVGKATNCVPTNMRLAGAPVVIIGTLNSKEYNGKYYYSISGEQLTIITAKSFAEKKPTIEQMDVDEVKDFDDLDKLASDDLPF